MIANCHGYLTPSGNTGSNVEKPASAPYFPKLTSCGRKPGGQLADAGQRVPGTSNQRYFFLRAADFLAARKEIPARIAFC